MDKINELYLAKAQNDLKIELTLKVTRNTQSKEFTTSITIQKQPALAPVPVTAEPETATPETATPETAETETEKPTPVVSELEKSSQLLNPEQDPQKEIDAKKL